MSRGRQRILILDDEDIALYRLREWSAAQGYDAQAFASGTEALAAVASTTGYDLALLDIRLLGTHKELQQRLHEGDPHLTIIVMTTAPAAAQAFKQGAYDYLTKPVNLHELSRRVANALELRKAKREVKLLREALRYVYPPNALIGASPAMKQLSEFVASVASTDAPVLIAGEIGTGKEAVARAIHAAGLRRDMPMIVIPSGGLTGARPLARGCDVFFEEIGELNLSMQTDLQHALQQKEGDFRCIAATSRDLLSMAKGGAFSPDLYSQLNVHAIELPPLRDRRDDIPLLVEQFLQKLCASTGRQPVPSVTTEALELLVQYEWPGNVRELQNALERALLTSRGQELSPAQFSFQLAPPGRTLEEVERAHIERVWRDCAGNHSRAARTLDIDRTTLYNKLRRFGLK